MLLLEEGICACLVAQLCPTLWDARDCRPPGSSIYGDSPVKNTGVDCHALLLGIFPTEGLNPASLMSSALASGFFTISTTSSYYLMIISAVIQQ